MNARSSRHVSRIRMAASLGAASLAALAGAAPAALASGAAHPYRHGPVPVLVPGGARTGPVPAPSSAPSNRAGRAASANDLAYHGGTNGIGVTTGAPKVYVVFWGSQWGSQSTDAQGNVTLSGDGQGVAPRLQSFFKGVGTSGELWSGVMTQYCEGVASGGKTCPAGSAQVGYPYGGALAGVWVDTSTSSPGSATAHQLGQEAVNAAGHFGNTTAALNRNAQYFIVSPTGTHPDGFNAGGNFCAWHDYSGDSGMTGGAVTSPYGDVAFTNMPYVPDAGASCGADFVNSGSAGTLDGVTIVGGHEYAETITDQFPGGGWWDARGNENGDKCAWISSGQGASQDVSFSTGAFAIQSTWANDFNGGAGGCEVSHPIVTSTAASPDYSLTASPSSQTVTQGGGAAYTVSVAPSGGFSSSVDLSVSGLPAGASGSFSPVSTATSSTLTVSTSASTVTGSYPLTITGISGSLSHTTTVTLVVSAPQQQPNFTLGTLQSSQTVAHGKSTSFGVTVSRVGGFSGSVTLSVSGLPSRTTSKFSPNPATTSSTLLLTTNNRAPAGTYHLTITGKGGGLTRTVTVTLIVT